MTSPATAGLGYHDFFSANRGGNLFTQIVNQRIGAVFALLAHRLGWAPTVLTLINLVFSLGSAILVIAVIPAAVAGDLPWWPIAVAAAIGWQVAYSLDCADGQLARATGTGSPAGARVDVLCDVVAQSAFVAAVVSVALAYSPDVPIWFVGVFASLWMVNLVTSILATGSAAGSIVASKHLVVELIKLIRDSGVIVLAMPLLLILQPQWMVWFMVFFAVTNGLFLAASIAFTAKDALRSTQPSNPIETTPPEASPSQGPSGP
ncbi:CDP-alcohol phosphatidyltransferase-like enzyme [Stackebrandtia endophytica]|uniref:CDP-alcohol phosphatidyltransferase-like enzyme n=1 Tax=Stackebrandtia endophytica TaxID=1496996 RepID=A0A543AX68_9ACTN|nr:CDP-alcohol phosphatidyltransferase family protein [Stackebrandtia endophytica]TQL77164.1 CDP-alcohol phosphatidyltransferase-like enzyme [Stackebrandtia endophytica]